jgi:hypothetical protein
VLLENELLDMVRSCRPLKDFLQGFSDRKHYLILAEYYKLRQKESFERSRGHREQIAALESLHYRLLSVFTWTGNTSLKLSAYCGGLSCSAGAAESPICWIILVVDVVCVFVGGGAGFSASTPFLIQKTKTKISGG